MSSIRYPLKFERGFNTIREILTNLGIHLNEERRMIWCDNKLSKKVTFQWNTYQATFENLLFKIAADGNIEISLGSGILNFRQNNLCFLMTMEFTDDMPQQANICSIFYNTALDAKSRTYIEIVDIHRNKLMGESRKAEATINFLKTIAKLFGCKEVYLQDYSSMLSKNLYFLYPMAELKYLQPSEFSSYYFRYGFERKDIPAEKKTIKLVSPQEISEQKLDDNNYEDFLNMMDLRISDAPSLCKVNEHILETSKKDSKDLPDDFDAEQYNQKLEQFKNMVFAKFKYLTLDDKNDAVAVNFSLEDYLFCDLTKLAISTSGNILHFVNQHKLLDEDVGTYCSSPRKEYTEKNPQGFSGSDESNDESDKDEMNEEEENCSSNKRRKVSKNLFSTTLSGSQARDFTWRSPYSNHDVPPSSVTIVNHDVPSVFSNFTSDSDDEGVRIEIDSGSDDDD